NDTLPPKNPPAPALAPGASKAMLSAERCTGKRSNCWDVTIVRVSSAVTSTGGTLAPVTVTVSSVVGPPAAKETSAVLPTTTVTSRVPTARPSRWTATVYSPIGNEPTV